MDTAMIYDEEVEESAPRIAEARLLLEWSRTMPEHHLQFDAWLERELTRAARSA